MAQGGVKFSAKSKGGSGSASKKGGIMKKGAKNYTPKNKQLAKQREVQRKLAATVNSKNEAILATRAGSVGKLGILKSMAAAGAANEKKKGKKK